MTVGDGVRSAVAHGSGRDRQLVFGVPMFQRLTFLNIASNFRDRPSRLLRSRPPPRVKDGKSQSGSRSRGSPEARTPDWPGPRRVPRISLRCTDLPPVPAARQLGLAADSDRPQAEAAKARSGPERVLPSYRYPLPAILPGGPLGNRRSPANA